MSHFAKVRNNLVETVIVAEQDFIDSGAVGSPSDWVQTSYNTYGGKHWTQNEDGTVTESSDQSKALRKNYPGVGWFYDEDNDYFYPPKPAGCDSWTLNSTTGHWEAPTAYPSVVLYTSDGKELGYVIKWDEDNNRWLGALEATPDTFDKVWNASSSAWDNL